jgi:hypothetical protein
MESYVEKEKVMRITRLPSQRRLLGQKELENVEIFNYLGSIIMNTEKCTHGIKSGIAMAKAAFSKK